MATSVEEEHDELYSWARNHYRLLVMKRDDPRQWERVRRIREALDRDPTAVDPKTGLALRQGQVDRRVEVRSTNRGWLVVCLWLHHPWMPSWGRGIGWVLWIVSAKLRALMAGADEGMAFAEVLAKKRAAKYRELYAEWNQEMLAAMLKLYDRQDSDQSPQADRQRGGPNDDAI